MGFFSRLFGGKAADDAGKTQALEQTLAPFIDAALDSLKAGDITPTAELQRLAMAYLFGASAYLAEYDGLSEEESRQFAGGIVAQRFNLSVEQRASLTEKFAHSHSKDAARFFMIEGASALRRWVAFQDRGAATRLGETLLRHFAKP